MPPDVRLGTKAAAGTLEGSADFAARTRGRGRASMALGGLVRSVAAMLVAP
jgi:hypothetical protein